MKRFLVLISLVTILFIPQAVLAVTPNLGKITPPASIKDIGVGAAGLGTFFSNIIEIIYVVGGIIFIFMLVFSAVQWLISGGDKEKVAQAKARLTYAIMGIVLLAVSFILIGTIGKITGFTLFQGQNNPPVTPTPYCQGSTCINP